MLRFYTDGSFLYYHLNILLSETGSPTLAQLKCFPPLKGPNYILRSNSITPYDL